MVFYRNLSDSKSHQVSWTLLSIWADPNNAFVWMVSTYELISNSFTPFANPLGIVPCALLLLVVVVLVLVVLNIFLSFNLINLLIFFISPFVYQRYWTLFLNIANFITQKMPPCLTLSIIRYESRIKLSNPEKGVAPSPTPRWSG